MIFGLEDLNSDSFNMCFHAGTIEINGEICANGGRVLNVTARGDSLQEARDRAYEAIAKIDWDQGFYRTDIGWRAL